MIIFLCVCWPSGCLLWRNVCSWLQPIFNWINSFGGVELHKFFIYFGPSLLLHMSFANTFSHFVGCHLVLCRSFLFWWGCSGFLLSFLALQDTYIKKFLQLMSEGYCVLSCKIVMVSVVTLKSFIHFQFFFCIWSKKVVQTSIFCMLLSQFPQHYLLKRLSFV